MAPRARRSHRAVKKASGKSKQSVSIDMVKEAIAALGDRNGSTIKSIFNYLVRTKKVSQSNRTLVILAIGRAVRTGVLAKKLPNTFVVRVGGAKKPSSPAKSRKRKARRRRKTSAKKTTKRRRRQRKRRTPKKKSRKSTKRSRKNRAQPKRRKARRSRKRTAPKPVAMSMSRRPVRKAARGKNYRI